MVISTDPRVQLVHGERSALSTGAPGGVSVATPDGVRKFHDLNDAPESGLIRVGGVELTVAEAKEFGLLPDIVKAGSGEEVETSGLKVHDYEEEAIENDSNLMDNADAAIQTTQAALDDVDFQLGGKLDDAAKAELVQDIVDGEIDAATEQALSNEGLPLNAAKGLIDSVAQEHSAKAERELGEEGFKWLSDYAAFDPSVREMLVAHAIRTARGGKVTYKDVYRWAVEKYQKEIRR